MKNHFKRIKLRKTIMQINPLIKNCFIERVYKSNNIFGKFPLEVKKPTILKRRGVLKSTENPESKIIKLLAKILILKTWLNFWGVTTLPPLRKISSSRFVKNCFELTLLLPKKIILLMQ